MKNNNLNIPSRKKELKNYALKKFIRSGGLTLIEIIVVLVILSILIAFLTSSLFSTAEGAKAKLTQIKMEKLKGAINNYRFMNNALPPNLEALVTCPPNATGPCVQSAQIDDLKDAWGTPMIYTIEGGRNFRIKSLGADGREGGSGTDADFSITGP
ncbi:MAG TPA: type II secretion system protein GspG [Oligoflexia bacterium]|nr:type II secretion system protein GspG [Oligoflexia bacterium]HMP27678.1 type II secretion system protein GspG [Oligoflexia bacterium]